MPVIITFIVFILFILLSLPIAFSMELSCILMLLSEAMQMR